MEILVKRLYKKHQYTIGKLYIDGVYCCDTLEDTDRGLKSTMPEVEIIRKKIYGKTAIPTGRYRVDMNTVSQKFRYRVWARPYDGKLPRLLSVPGYNGVLIHVGNQSSDTEGCLLAGKNRAVGKVLDSTRTFYDLMDKHLVPANNRGEAIWITIE